MTRLAVAAWPATPEPLQRETGDRARAGPELAAAGPAAPLIFDNTKLRGVVPDFRPAIPFEQGAREIVAWYDAAPARQATDPRVDAVMDNLISTYRVR